MVGKFIGKLRKSEKGQALVELALVVPILLMLIFGITEFGRVFGTQLILLNSAREGVRYAAVGASDTEVVTKIINNSSMLDNTKLNISITPSDSVRQRGESVEIKIQYPVEIYAPIISQFTGNPYVAKGVAIMRME